MNVTTVKDYLSSITSKNEANETYSSPAILFKNDADQKFGEIYLFEKFGQAENNTYQISSQITEHYMEDNVARQDHWAIAPDKYILSGFIGEVIYHPVKKWRSAVEKYVTDYLYPLRVLSPIFDSYTQSALNIVQAVETSYRRYEQIAENIFNDISNVKITKTNQQYIAEQLKAIQLNRQLVTIWTPYGTFDSFAVLNASLVQGNTKYKSRLEVELKQWRTIATETREATAEEKKAYIARVQQAEEQNLGTAATNEKPVSSLKVLVQKGINLFKID